MAYDRKERYRRLKALKLCTSCAKVPAKPGQTLCEECRQKYNEYHKVDNSYKIKHPKKVIPAHSLGEVSRMAYERGISYGQMVVLLERKEKR